MSSQLHFKEKCILKIGTEPHIFNPSNLKKKYEKTLNLKSKLIHFVYIDGKETRLIGIRHKKSPSLNRNRHLLPIWLQKLPTEVDNRVFLSLVRLIWQNWLQFSAAIYALFKYSNSPFKERQHQQSALIYLQFRNTPQMVQHCHILLCFCLF